MVRARNQGHGLHAAVRSSRSTKDWKVQKLRYCRKTESAVSVFHGLVNLLACFGLFLVLTLVVEFLAAGDSQLQFRTPLLEVHPQWNERETALRGFTSEFGDLAAV